MSGDGLKQQWGVGDPAQPGSDAQSQQLHAAFDKIADAMSADLQYTAVNGERARHEPLAARDQALVARYQGVLQQIDPADPGKAQGAIDGLLADANALAQEIKTYRTEAEKDFNDWQSKSAAYDQAVTQVEELTEWQHPKAGPVQALSDAVRGLVNDRAYAKASSTLDAFLPKLQPIYEDLQKQKAAQAEYDPLASALVPRLDKAAAPSFHKLEPQQTELASTRTTMEAAAGGKDFVSALASAKDLQTKSDAFEAALDAMTKAKGAYEEASAAALPKLQAAPSPCPFHKLEAQQAELAPAQQQMESAAAAEEFEQATQQANDLATKADAYTAAVDEMTKAKQAYDEASGPVLAHLQAAPNPSPFQKLAAQQAELLSNQQAMEASAQSEDFVPAAQMATELGSKVDAYVAAVDEMTKAKQAYDEASGPLLPKLQTAPSPSPFQKLAAQQAELVANQQMMEAAAKAEDFQSAAQMATDLSGKADAYMAAVDELTKAKQAYDDASAQLLPKLQAAPNPSPFQKLAAQQAELATAQQAMEAAAQGEDFPQAAQLATDLGAKVDAYQGAVDAMTKAKQACEQESGPVLQRLQAAPNPCPYPKLASQQAELGAAQQAMEAAVQAEDFEQALAKVGELATKVDAYVAAVNELDTKKKAYEDALASIQPLLDQATQSQVPEAAGVQKELQTLRQQMEAAAQANDYDQANKLVGDVKDKADAVVAVTPSSGISTTFNYEFAPENPIAESERIPYVKGKATVKLEISGEISGVGSSNKVKAGSTGLPGVGNAGFKGEIEIFKTKFGEGFAGTKFTEAKGSIGFELSQKKVDINVGVTFKIQTGWSWLAGTGGVKFKFVSAEWKKLEANKAPTVASLEFTGGLQGEGTLKGEDVGLAEGYQIKVTVKGTITAAFAPDWAKIFEEAGEKIAKEGAKEVAKGAAEGAGEGAAEGAGEGAAEGAGEGAAESAGAIVTFDAIVTTGLIAVAVGTIAGAVNEVSKSIDLRNLINSVSFCKNSFLTGYAKGIRMEGAPGDAWGAAGHKRGTALIQKAMQAYWDANKDKDTPTPDEVHEEGMRVVLKKAGPDNGQVVSAVNRMVGDTFWPAWVEQNHGVGTFLGDARTACGICYFKQGSVGDNDPDLKRWKDATDLPNFLT